MVGSHSSGSLQCWFRFHGEEAESDGRLCLVSSFYTVLDIGVVQQSGVLVHRPSRGPPPLTVLLVEAVFLLLVSMFSPWFCDFAQHWFQHGVPVGDFEVQGLDLILAQVRGMVPLCFKLKKE